MPQISCTIIINIASFGFNIMKMCITTIEIQQTIFIGCMTVGVKTGGSRVGGPELCI